MKIENFKIFLHRFRILLIFLIITIPCIVFFVRKIKARNELLLKSQELDKSIEKVNAEITDLRNREFAINQDKFHLEKLARNKLSYAKDDELIYHFEDQDQ